MEFFDLVEDIEETYKFLKEKAEEENSNDIEKFKKQQEKNLDNITMKKQEFIQLISKSFLEEVFQGIESFKISFNHALLYFEKEFQKKNTQLIELIIDRLGFEF